MNDADCKPPFALTAKLNKLTMKVDRPQLSPADIDKLQAAMQDRAMRYYQAGATRPVRNPIKAPPHVGGAFLAMVGHLG